MAEAVETRPHGASAQAPVEAQVPEAMGSAQALLPANGATPPPSRSVGPVFAWLAREEGPGRKEALTEPTLSDRLAKRAAGGVLWRPLSFRLSGLEFDVAAGTSLRAPKAG
jgi:hypothetical protein